MTTEGLPKVRQWLLEDRTPSCGGGIQSHSKWGILHLLPDKWARPSVSGVFTPRNSDHATRPEARTLSGVPMNNDRVREGRGSAVGSALDDYPLPPDTPRSSQQAAAALGREVLHSSLLLLNSAQRCSSTCYDVLRCSPEAFRHGPLLWCRPSMTTSAY